MNRREFIKQVVTTSVLFTVSSVGLAELLVKAKSPVGVQGPTVLQVPPATPGADPGALGSGNQTTSQGGTSNGTSGGSTGGSSGGSTSGSGGSGGASGGSGGTSGGSGGTTGGSGGTGGTSGGSGGTSSGSGGTTGGSGGTTSGSGGTSGGSGGTSGGSGGTPQPPAGYIYLAAVTAVSGSSAYFNHPSGGSCVLVDYNGTWRAFSAICTHAGCVCNFTGSALYCPCHSANFSATNGAVLNGPPKTPLAEYDIQIVNNSFYVSPNRIN